MSDDPTIQPFRRHSSGSSGETLGDKNRGEIRNGHKSQLSSTGAHTGAHTTTTTPTNTSLDLSIHASINAPVNAPPNLLSALSNTPSPRQRKMTKGTQYSTSNITTTSALPQNTSGGAMNEHLVPTSLTGHITDTHFILTSTPTSPQSSSPSSPPSLPPYLSIPLSTITSVRSHPTSGLLITHSPEGEEGAPQTLSLTTGDRGSQNLLLFEFQSALHKVRKRGRWREG